LTAKQGRRAGILGIGTSIPDRVLTNAELEEMVDTSNEWIVSRTGIRERRIAAEEETTGDLAEEAARKALAAAGLTPGDLELIIVATVTPDMPFPATACILQDRLGAPYPAAFDLEAACSGFVYALAMASQAIETGLFDNALIIGAETLSKITDFTDRGTCVLLGDGAGAAVLGPVEDGSGVLSSYLGADGGGGEFLMQPAGGSLNPATVETVEQRLHYVKMEGREVFKFAVRKMGDAAQEALDRCGMDFEDVDLYVPHQANYRIIESSARRFGLPMDKVMVNIDRYGNTSSASIPVALDEANAEGRINSGDIVLLVAFGGGLTWGSAVVRWT
jgi:3-oxoacyl-[acyl-carrier-protein] synthase-3